MGSSDDKDDNDEIYEPRCILPNGGTLRFVQEEHERSMREQGWWENRPRTSAQNEASRKRWMNRQINNNSLFKWSAENHSKTKGGIEQAEAARKAERKRLEALDEPSPF